MKSSSSAKSRSAVAAPNSASSAAAPAPAPASADAVRQQGVVASEAAAALRRGFEAMREIQEQAMRSALERHAVAARKLRSAPTPADAIALQAELLRSDMQAVVRYLQELTAASVEMEAELVNCSTHLVDSEAVLEGSAMLKSLPFAVPGLQTFFTSTTPFMDPSGTGYQPRAEAS